MNAIVTGSRAYGAPKPQSDIDLVVLVSHEDYLTLRSAARCMAPNQMEVQESDGNYHGMGAMTTSLRFGDLNLIVTTDPVQYEVWRRGTAKLAEIAKGTGRPVLRDRAVKYFKALRKHFGVLTKEPTLGEATNPEPEAF